MKYGWTLHLGVCGIMTSQLFYGYEGVSTQKLSENSTTTDFTLSMQAGVLATWPWYITVGSDWNKLP